MKDFKHLILIEKIKEEFKIDYYGDHGINHWRRVYENTQRLAVHHSIESEVFELFALLHDSKRHDEFQDKHHGKRAAEFTQTLLDEALITIDDKDTERLIYACSNHTHSDKKHPLFSDLIVQICFDSDRLDIDRVGFEIDIKYLATDYAKSLVIDGQYRICS